MNPIPHRTPELLLAIVRKLVAALMDEQDIIDTDLSADALALLMAAQIELNPNLSSPARLRQAAEQHALGVYRYAKLLRTHFEETGIHFAEQIGGRLILARDAGSNGP